MKVYFIGAGPGDPELITIKGKRVLEKAGVVIYTGSLVNPEILNYAPQAKVYNSATMTLEEIMVKMEEAFSAGKIVARLHTGDPSIYGAIQEQMDYLKKKGIEFEIIPGVSSFVAAAAVIEREFTLPGVSQTVILTRMEGRISVPEKERLWSLAKHEASMAIFLSVQMIEGVVEELKEGYSAETPIAVIQKASWPDEKIIKGNLEDIVVKVKEAGIKKTAMILVGDFLACDYAKSNLYDKNFSHGFREAKRGEKCGVENQGKKKAILVASFGTSYLQTRALNIEACENRIRDSFPEYEVRRAFTSEMIIKKLKKRDNILFKTPTEALTKLKEEGFREVIVQPLHIINGKEYHDLVRELAGFKNYFVSLKIGETLLSNMDDYLKVMAALKTQLPEFNEKEAVVFMGHGTYHSANSSYACLDYLFKDHGLKNVFIGTVEGYPRIDSVIKRLKEKGIKKVILMPLMLVAGDHAINDMAGTGDHSWKTILTKEGFIVETYLHGLGENGKIQEMYITKLRKLLER